jgi:DNA mismatch endonuclease Vsr
MSRTRQSGTKAEAEVGAVLRQLGLSYRKNVRKLPGSPDFANASAKWAVFVHGCYWHHHRGCNRASIPKANREFWTEKFRVNRQRDARSIHSLRQSGFTVMIVWECEIDRLKGRLAKIFETRRVDA